MKARIEETYAEAFDGFYTRLMVTAEDDEILRAAAEDSTATPSTVIGRVEGGIERFIDSKYAAIDKYRFAEYISARICSFIASWIFWFIAISIFDYFFNS